MQTASVSPAQTFASYNNTSVVDRCQEENKHLSFTPKYMLFALVGSDGMTSMLGGGGLSSSLYVAATCSESATLVPTNEAEGRKLVYVGPMGDNNMVNTTWRNCVVTGLGSGATVDGCRKHESPIRWKYNFETGIVSNEDGEEYKRGARCPWAGCAVDP